MTLKIKLLFVLFITLLGASILASGLLLLIVQRMEIVALNPPNGWILFPISTGVYLIVGALLFGLLSALLKNKEIVHTESQVPAELEHSMLIQQAQQTQKMETVGRLAGSIAHDFNNLLTIIDGYSSLIIANPQATTTEAYAQEVVEAARKASTITRKLLSFSEMEPADHTRLDLNALLTKSDPMLSRFLGEHVQLATQVCSESIYVEANAIQLGQMLLNLVANAHDAMPAGGCVTLRVSQQQVADGERNKPRRFPAGAYAMISVHDTGIGMDREISSHIFEPFFTTKHSKTGTGLGLALVKTIVKQAQGFIDFTSQRGKGTTFMIYLPLAEPQAEAPIHTPSSTPADSPSETPTAHTILLVEDDPTIRELVSLVLEQQDYSILVANDGWEAIQAARHHKGPIDLLFTDVLMPGLGGAELALALRELYPDIVVLFTSGCARAQLSAEGIPPDAKLLEKPFTPDQVIAELRALLTS